MTIAQHLQKVFQRIDQAANQYTDNGNPVTLLAVSKTHKSFKIREAYEAGQIHFGESYIQEAVGKITELNDCDICWHFIGPIQSNKTAKIAEHFHWVQSVDRMKVAERLSKQRPTDLAPLNVCLQVNISDDPNKSGLKPDQLVDFMQQVRDLSGLKLRGLMCIPTQSDNFAAQRQAFHEMQRLYNQLKEAFPELDTLSMGMSGDFEAAIAEGSTMIRVGTDIFGARNKTRN